MAHDFKIKKYFAANGIAQNQEIFHEKQLDLSKKKDFDQPVMLKIAHFSSTYGT